MPAETDAPDARLVLPERYFAQEAENGRLAIYELPGEAWVGEVDPLLSNAQDLANAMLIAYEASKRVV